MRKSDYLDLMESLVMAYSPKQIEDYIEKVRQQGVWEHGFPRLGADLGILMAYGRLLQLKPYFLEIMELCCRDLPVPAPDCQQRGNDFSVKELCWCLMELEKTDLFPAEYLQRWRSAIAAIEPKRCYNAIAPEPAVRMGNWAAFNAASEQIRNYMGLADTKDFIENQVASQMFSFEENGMYRDPHEPMLYDIVTRLQMINVLHFGYDGSYKEELENHLRKAAKLTLFMQSVTGELPFGGRSIQFLHNEADIASVCEYEAVLCAAQGDMETAGAYKAAAQLAVDNIKKWWQENPDHHIKNYYPIYSMEGCEDYAYYDKYMVTTASMLYNACLYCDDTIPVGTCPAESGVSDTWQTGPWFHQVFCRAGEYFAELEYEAYPEYDASGIGRVHRRNAPSTICLSCPVSQTPNYQIEAENPHGMSLCGGSFDGQWQFATGPDSQYRNISHTAKDDTAEATWEVRLPNGAELAQKLTVGNGVAITTEGEGLVGLMIPAFSFDGQRETEVALEDSALCVRYKGWVCRFRTDGMLTDTGAVCHNRNGRYRIFRAENQDSVTVSIDIEQE